MRVFSLFFTVQPRGLTFLLHRHQTGSQVVLVQCFVLSTTQRPYFFVNFWLSPDDPTYFCIFLSLNAKNHALTQWPLIFWACALTKCPSLLEGGPYTRIHFIWDCPPPPPGLLPALTCLSSRIFKMKMIFQLSKCLFGTTILKVLATIPYFNFHFFPHFLIFLQLRDPSCVLNLSTKAVQQKWHI